MKITAKHTMSNAPTILIVRRTMKSPTPLGWVQYWGIMKNSIEGRGAAPPLGLSTSRNGSGLQFSEQVSKVSKLDFCKLLRLYPSRVHFVNGSFSGVVWYVGSSISEDPKFSNERLGDALTPSIHFNSNEIPLALFCF